MAATDDESRAFAAAFTSFLEWVHHAAVDDPDARVVDLVRGHLGAVWAQRSVVTRELPSLEHVNLQLALDAWSARGSRTVEVHGIGVPPNYGGITLQQLLSGYGLPPLRLGAPDLVDLPSGPGRTTACLQSALLLVTDDTGRYALLVRGPQRHEPPELTVEVAGLEVADAQAVHEELGRLRSELNVYRGQVLDLSAGPAGGVQVQFAQLPSTAREDVVLPEDVLHRVERHTVDVAGHRDALRAAGQHLKRGLLLFGPPGTGKTHTTRYVVGRMTGCTVLLLSGRSLHLIGALADMARELQPTVVVLEDVDLVAEDREFGPGSSPVLFELLDVMDGAAGDADLLFLLTTNRADLLEPALAARPGRVDVAVEIAKPDEDGRRRLLALYGRDVPLRLAEADVAQVVARTAGTTASFLKELLRRAVLESLAESSPLEVVTAVHVSRALDDLLDSGQQITRALLGAGDDQHRAGRGAGGHGGATGWALDDEG
ncbi:AAA family ATPase [Jannaschia sp. R86511]|uniref:AAA family ATPase n=1 Tax=Jannaschia sp. R86511 TaxID=3093853 RepID=UPI0036D25E53